MGLRMLGAFVLPLLFRSVLEIESVVTVIYNPNIFLATLNMKYNNDNEYIFNDFT